MWRLDPTPSNALATGSETVVAEAAKPGESEEALALSEVNGA